MKRRIVKIIHKIKPKFFKNMSFEKLDKWGIEDVLDNKIIFKGDSITFGNGFNVGGIFEMQEMKKNEY